jgi:hypothetical protein
VKKDNLSRGEYNYNPLRRRRSELKTGKWLKKWPAKYDGGRSSPQLKLIAL